MLFISFTVLTAYLARQRQLVGRAAVMYLMAKSCLHLVINYLRLPECDQNIPYLSPYDQPVPNSTKKPRNSAEMGKFHGLAQNSAFCGKCGPYESHTSCSDYL